MKTLGKFITVIIFASITHAQTQVTITCYPENAPSKRVIQLGCDAINQGPEPAAIPAGEFRRQAIQYLNSPLRPSTADVEIQRRNERGFWGWVVRVVQWSGFGWSIAQGFIPEERLSDIERASPGGVSGIITLIDTFVGQRRQIARLPLDYFPETINLPPGGSDNYTLYALPQASLKAFTVAITTSPLSTPTRTTPANPGGLLFIPTGAPYIQQWADHLMAKRESRYAEYELVAQRFPMNQAELELAFAVLDEVQNLRIAQAGRIE